MQTYAETKDSGVQWLGKVPLDWKLCKLKHVSIIKTGSTPKSNEGINIDRLGRMWFTPSDSSANFCLGKSSKYITDEAIAKFNIKLYKPFSVLFVGIGKIGVVGITESESYSNQQITAIQPTAINPRFLLYAIHQLTPALAELAPNTMLPIVNNLMLANTSLAIPSKTTQQKIADFLDIETTQIDNLIAKQERLLELLEEKRRATITHAVTRGLDSSVELKETNIPWLAQIPAHWNVKRIKDLFSANDEALGQKTDPNYGFDYVDISSVDKYRGIIKKEKMTFEKSPSRARRIVREGDIIIGAVRTYLEAIAQISEDATSLIVSTGFVVLRPKDVGDSDFYFYALRSGSFMANVVANSDGVSYPAINADKLMSLQIAVPPKDEMRTIIEHCKLEMSRMDELKQKIQTQIALLRERRTSLISHAVTGKVKIT